MNIKAVLRTYGMLRALTDDETALLETLRSLNESEREALTLAVEPPKVVKKAGKKAGKSARAKGLSEAVRSNLQQRAPVVGGFADDADMLSRKREHCQWPPDDNTHHLESDENHHPFRPVPSAAAPSSPSNGAASSTANTEGEMGSVAAVVGGSGE